MINDEWIKRNELYQQVLKEVEATIPEWVAKDQHGVFSLKANYVQKMIDGSPTEYHIKKYHGVFPMFQDESQEEIKKEFYFEMLIDVAKLREGIGFGELALINEAPRSATIRSVSEVHFSTLEKDDFNSILGKVMKKKFDSMIKFMNQFVIFKCLTRLALEKLALFMKREEATRGKKIIQEQDDASFIYFIENGEFEISKEIYTTAKKKEYGNNTQVPYKAKFLKFISYNSNECIASMFEEDSLMLYSDNKSELEDFRTDTKKMKRHKERVSILGKNECVGLIEWALNCPYWVTTVTWISNEASYFKIHKEDLFRRIDTSFPPMLKLTKQKLILLSKTIRDFIACFI